MIEKYLSVQDTLAVGGFLLALLFIAVKLIQRKEGWGWKRDMPEYY